MAMLYQVHTWINVAELVRHQEVEVSKNQPWMSMGQSGDTVHTCPGRKLPNAAALALQSAATTTPSASASASSTGPLQLATAAPPAELAAVYGASSAIGSPPRVATRRLTGILLLLLVGA
jgi:hypothetical protein